MKIRLKNIVSAVVAVSIIINNGLGTLFNSNAITMTDGFASSAINSTTSGTASTSTSSGGTTYCSSNVTAYFVFEDNTTKKFSVVSAFNSGSGTGSAYATANNPSQTGKTLRQIYSVHNSTVNVTNTSTKNLLLSEGRNITSKTYFSQKNPLIGNGYYVNNLDKLYTNSSAYPILSSVNASSANQGEINREGCVMSSMAMILSNKGEKTAIARYDFRTGNTEKLAPDPFTVTWANVGFPTITPNGSDYKLTYSLRDSNNNDQGSIYAYNYTRTATGFNYTKFEKKSLSGKTDAQKVSELSAALTAHPEGIIVRVNSDKHSLVFTEYNSSGTTNEAKFICYDPVASSGTSYQEVTFKAVSDLKSYGGLAKVSYYLQLIV